MKMIVVILGVLLTGCESAKTWTPSGGSRSDGVVEVSYTHTAYEIPTTKPGQEERAALPRCKAWGYDGVDAFGFKTSTCTQSDGYGGCSRYLVETEVQCTGKDD